MMHQTRENEGKSAERLGLGSSSTRKLGSGVQINVQIMQTSPATRLQPIPHTVTFRAPRAREQAIHGFSSHHTSHRRLAPAAPTLQ